MTFTDIGALGNKVFTEMEFKKKVFLILIFVEPNNYLHITTTLIFLNICSQITLHTNIFARNRVLQKWKIEIILLCADLSENSLEENLVGCSST